MNILYNEVQLPYNELALMGILPSKEDLSTITDLTQGLSKDNVLIRSRDKILEFFRSRGLDGAVNVAFGANKLWHDDIPNYKIGSYAPEWARLHQGVIDAFLNMGRADLANYFRSTVPVYTTTVHPIDIVNQLLASGVPASATASLPPPPSSSSIPTAPGSATVPAPTPLPPDNNKWAMGDTKNLWIMGGIAVGVAALAVGAHYISKSKKKAA